METRFQVRLQDLCHSNIGWLTDKSIADAMLSEWDIRGVEGVYLLWHKNEYCPTHELFHMRALYVGKGPIATRLFSHWRDKDFSEEMLVYWTFKPLPNRQAKYVEQLLLDTFAFPLNKAENGGNARLCVHFTQEEVD